MALSILLMADDPGVTASKSRRWRHGAGHAFQQIGVVPGNAGRYVVNCTIDPVAGIVESLSPQLRSGAGRSRNHEN